MTQYNTLNVKSFNSQLNKSKSGIKNGTEVTLNLSSNVISDSNDEANFSHELLLTDGPVSRLRKAFANGSSAYMKLSRTQISKMVQLGGFSPLSILELPNILKSSTGHFISDLTKIKDYVKSEKDNPRFFLNTGHNILGKKLNGKL